MRAHLYLLLAIGLLASVAHGKTVFRRTDKISENFKQLDLSPDEIDPNVAPPQPPKVDPLDPEDVVDHSSNAPTETAEDPIDEDDAEEAATAASASVDETANEVDAVIDEAIAAAVPALGGAIAPPVPAESAAAAAAAPAAVSPVTAKPVKGENETSGLGRYCKCKDSHCDCCRKFSLPLIPVNGPGCARISYLGNEKMSVSIKYGDITLASRTISSKNARPICVGLPGGYSKFCGRVYGLSKEKTDKSNFKACLGFELRAEDEVEAALRVSCFKFGPEGLRVAEAEPFPEPPKAEEDDDDDDIFGFAAGADEEDEEEEDEEDDADEAYDDEEDDDDADEAAEEAENDDEAPEDADYGGFSLAGLLEELADDEEETPAKPAKPAAATPVAAADQTRAVVQSKDDQGTEAAIAEAAEAFASAEAAAAADSVTPAPAAADAAAATTTVKSKKSKKSKKNKKKKAATADTSETSFAYEILNGILDFFN